MYGGSAIWILFVVALIYLFIAEKPFRKTVVLPAVALLIVVLNPVCYTYLWKPMVRYAFWRMFWLFPVVPVIALAATCAVLRIRGRLNRKAAGVLAAIAMAALIGVGGNCVYSYALTSFSPASNPHKLPGDVLAVGEFLLKQDPHPRVVVEQELYSYIRQIYPDITTLYGRNNEGFISKIEPRRKEVALTLRNGELNLNHVASCMRELNFDYLVKTAHDARDLLLEKKYRDAGFEKIGQIGTYGIFQLEKESLWTITQYPSVTDSQCMLYSIEDNKGHFALVDSGLNQDAEQLLHLILDHGGHVDTWIITHPHPDHVGGFNNLMLTCSDMFTVDRIYTIEVNKAVYEKKAKPWDDINTFYMMEEAIEGLENITYLHAGDETDLIGLNMKVLSAWDEHTDEQPTNLPNNGSMMFKLTGKQESILFCADVEEEMEPYILPAYVDELAADYVQCGHHGNDGLSQDFYTYVNAKKAFMDAPGWLLDPESKYTAYALKTFLESRGTEVMTFATAPNKIKLK